MEKTKMIIIIIFVFITIIGVVLLYPKNNGMPSSSGSYEDYVLSFDQSKVPLHRSIINKDPQMVNFGRLINIGSGQGGFCRVYLKNNKFYVFSGEFYKGSYVREYDENWEYTGFEKILIPVEGKGLGDHDAAFDGEYLYQFQTGPRHANDIGSTSIAVVYKYDTDEFNLVSIGRINAIPNERITDHNIAVINGKIYAGSEYREEGNLWKRQEPGPGSGPFSAMSNIPPNINVARALLLRIFDKEMNFLEEKNLIANINGAVVPHQYWGMGVSQLYADGYYCIVTHTPIGNVTSFTRGESIGARQIFVLRFDDDFNFVDSKGPLTDTNNDNFWCTGSWYEDGRYYISYTCRRPGELGLFREDQANIRLSIYDEEFRELETIDVTNVQVDPASPQKEGCHRSSIFKVDNKLYVSYDGPGGIWVQELILKN